MKQELPEPNPAGALIGRRIALAEGRQIEELAGMLQKHGATILRCPMVSMIDAPDPEPVLDWIRALIAGELHLVVLLTGEGLRRLVALAERHDLQSEFIQALSRVPTLTRGPKPVRALREIGLSPTRVAGEPTTQGVITALREQPLQGQHVGIQLYGDANRPLIEFCEAAGAVVRTVQPYAYAPASDADRVVNLIDEMAAGQVDMIVFTSKPQVERLFEVAKESNRDGLLQEGLDRTRIAAVGPIVADAIRQKNERVAVCPEQGFVMKNLVQHIVRALSKTT